MYFYQQTYLQPNCKTIVMEDFMLRPPQPEVWSVSGYYTIGKHQGMFGNHAVGHSCLKRQVVFGELCYITFDRKKHLPERIVPLRVPFPG